MPPCQNLNLMCGLPETAGLRLTLCLKTGRLLSVLLGTAARPFHRRIRTTQMRGSCTFGTVLGTRADAARKPIRELRDREELSGDTTR